MLVPIELYRLVNRLGYLSPELALGWRLGGYFKEFFDGLEVVRLSARAHSETVLSLSTMLGWQRGDSVVVIGDGRPPWNFECYHPLTGTLLEVRPLVEQTTLPSDVEALVPDLSSDPRAARAYAEAVDRLVERLLAEPVTSYCAVDEHRCRRSLGASSKARGAPRSARCRRCGAICATASLWVCEGVLCCIECAGLRPEWFDRQ